MNIDITKTPLVLYMGLLIKNNNVPDELSIDWNDSENPIIRLYWWNSGKIKEYIFKSDVYRVIWIMYKSYWRSIDEN